MDKIIKKSIGVGTIQAPPSKSMAHRYLISAFLSGEECNISGLEESKDVLATLGCIESLKNNEDLLFCNESGSTLRFMIPICLLQEREITLTGSEKLFSRPLSVYEDICNERNLLFKKDGNKLTVKGKLPSGNFKVPGNISSQFITGLLVALPLLDGDSMIHVMAPVESKSYIDMTLEVLRDFGIQVNVTEDDGLKINIPGNQKYNPGDYVVEGDYSNAAFLDAFNLIGGNVNVTGLKADSLQGDRVYKKHYEMLKGENAVIDITDCPDLGPILIALAAAVNGATLTGTARLKIKESDRGEAMKAELKKMGVDIKVNEDTIIIPKSELKAPTEPIDSHNDHRIVMAMATLLTLTGGKIVGAQAVQKSYPSYFDAIQSLGIEVE